MPASETADRFFDALSEGVDALLDAAKAGNERTYRLSRSLLDEAERSQREALELGRQFARSPRDLRGFSQTLVEALTRGQGRALDLARFWLEEGMESGREARETLSRLVQANRRAGEAAIQAARGTLSRAAGAVRSAGGDGAGAREPARGRRGGRKTIPTEG